MFETYEFEDIIRIGIAVVVFIAGLLSIAYIIWWGFLMILSGGNEEKIKPAVNHIRHAIIGVVFLLAILFILPVLMGLLGLSYGEYMKPQAILNTIGEVSGKMFGMANDPSSTDFSENSTDTLPADFNDL